MDDLFGTFPGLILLTGWGFGVAGFLLIMRARSRIDRLETAMAALRREAAVVPSEAAVETIAEQPAPEAQAPEEPDIPPPVPEPVAAPPKRDIEALLTARWGVWLGSAALLLAGVFLIRYAVEEGLLGPGVRCALAAVLGLALLGGAEWLHRRDAGPRLPMPDQAAPALAAGGVAVLFGAAYGASVIYELLPLMVGFVAMAAVSVLGLAASLRYGPLVAATGLVGAFATPAMMHAVDPSFPGLFGYLLCVTAAALGVVRYTAWTWLGWATMFAGAAWVLLCLAANEPANLWAAAFFVPAAVALNLALLPRAALEHETGRYLAWIPAAVLGVAGLAVAVSAQRWDTDAGVWLLAPLMVWRAATEPRLRLLPWLAVVLALVLLAAWAVGVSPVAGMFVPPGVWTPEVVLNMMRTGALIAAFFAAAGLWFERQAPYPLSWASLAAAVPVLALTICYWRIAGFAQSGYWGAVALALAAALTGAAGAATPDRQRAGVHAAGAVAALALGFAMLLANQWLTLSVSLLLPALAWIEAKADLPPLRHVARAVATVVLIRLLTNWYVATYAFGETPLANGLLLAYGVPAIAFAAAAVLFRRRADDALVATLETGAAAFATVLAALEIRHAFGLGQLTSSGFDFPEAASHVLSLAVLANVTMRIAIRQNRPALGAVWRVQGGLAVLGAIGLLVLNPFMTGSDVGQTPVANWLLAGYLAPAGMALLALPGIAAARGRRMLSGLALMLLFAWVTLEVRHWFHPDRMGGFLNWSPNPVSDAELWAYSWAWLGLGGALMGVGVWRGVRGMRLAALGIVGLATAKIFLVDMADLVGLWRVLSFLGLGLMLIGLGAVYRRFVAVRGEAGDDRP